MSEQDTSSFDLLVNIQSYPDDELKALVMRLETEEREISKKRRLLHGQLDLVRAEMVRRLRDKHNAGAALFDEADISRLSSILSSRGLTDGDPASESDPHGAS
jgi:hypothetical protein